MMERHIRPMALYLLAFAWPWSVYQTEPVFFQPFFVLPVLLLVLTELHARLNGRRFAAPFEFLWPWAVLLGAALARALHVDGAAPLPAACMAAAAFAVAVQSAREQDVRRRCLGLSVLAGAGAGAVSLFAYFRPFHGYVFYRLMPAAYSPETGAVLAFPASVPEGVLTLAVCTLIGLGFMMNPGGAWWRRAAAAVACAVMLAALGTVAAEVFLRPGTLPRVGGLEPASALRAAFTAWRPPAAGTVPPATLVAGAALLWLMSRIAAKGIAGWREQDHAPRLAGAAAVVAGAVLLVLLPGAAYPGHAVLLGLIAGGALPRRTPDTGGNGWLAGVCVLLLPLIALNAVRVDPGNPRDPRNYAVRVRQWDAAAVPGETLRRYLAFIEHYSPAERRTRYILASAWLEAGNLEQAAWDFGRAMVPPTAGPGPLLPPPSARERAAFLSKLRDTSSARPVERRGLAYERALIASGQPELAIDSLRFRVHTDEAPAAGAPAYAAALAYLLGAPEAERTLRAWGASELLELLVQAGAEVQPHLQGAEGPAVLTVRRGPDFVEAQLWLGGGAAGMARRLPGCGAKKARPPHAAGRTPEKGRVLVLHGGAVIVLVALSPAPLVEVSCPGADTRGTPDTVETAVFVYAARDPG